MGQTLSSPAVSKKTEQGGNAKFHYAVSEMQGWRITMEDSHAIELNLDCQSDDTESNTFFAVYDGHGGASVAKYAGEHVHKRLIQEDAYREQQYHEALKRAFLNTDADMKSNPSFLRDPAGCTAVAALVTNDDRVFVANAGDSRSVISSKGYAKALSNDHKPQNDIEKARIFAAGGFIEFGRVNGNLALARALGDFDYKKNNNLSPEAQIITCDPEIIEHQITEDDEFIIIACDGIWDCLTSQQAIDCTRLLISQGKELAEVCEILCDHCLAPDTNSGAGIGCDNMTIMIIALLHGRTKEEWYAWVTERVKQNIGKQVPSELPPLYSMTRIMNFRARKAAEEERSKRFRQAFPVEDGTQISPFARILGAGGVNQIAFSPRGLGYSDNGLMFDGDGDDDSDNDEATPPKDVTKSLKQQLDELEHDAADAREHEGQGEDTKIDSDGDSAMDHASPPLSSPSPPSDATSKKSQSKGKERELQGEAPPPPNLIPNGTAKPAQLLSEPGGDEPTDAVRAEGFLDSSEDPLKV